MKTIWLSIMCVLGLCGSAWTQAGAERPAAQPQNVQVEDLAMHVFSIGELPEGKVPLACPTFGDVWREFKQAAIPEGRDILHISDPEIAAKAIQVSFSDNFSLLGDLKVRDLRISFQPATPELEKIDRATREKFTARIAAQVPDVIRRICLEPLRLQMEQASVAADLSRGRADRAQAEANALRDELRKATGRADVTPARLREALASLDAERQKLQIDAAAAAARRKAIEEVLGAAAKKASLLAESDAITRELRAILDARTAETQTIRQLSKTGTVSSQQLLEAQAAESEARVRILERGEQIARQAGGPAIDEMNKQLLEASVQTMELEARLKSIQAAVQRLVDATRLTDSMDAALQAATMETRAATRDAERRRQLETDAAGAQMPRVIGQ
ncbi:MAG: hypothetical protein ABSH20_15780 [Tepidisphaeraceae bacterium]|jgi:hypothetical protein